MVGISVATTTAKMIMEVFKKADGTNQPALSVSTYICMYTK